MAQLSPGLVPSRGHVPLTHDLGDVIHHLSRIERRRALERDPIYQANRARIDALLAGFGWRLQERPPGAGTLRAVSWNIERGKRLDGILHLLRSHPLLRDADLVLLNEVDLGMGRTRNRDVAAELGEGLGLDHVYANLDLVLSPGDRFERDHDLPNALGLHGSALLTSLPVTRIFGLPLPEPIDKFHALEKRLGTKRALLVEVQLVDGPLTVVVVHLDPFAGPRHRAAQMRRVMEGVRALGNERVLLGGDLNTNTYDLSHGAGLALNALHKLFRLGFEGTIREYMTPERIFERGTFAAMEDAGLAIEGFNDRSMGTTWYDIHDPELRDWTDHYLPVTLKRWLERGLAPWGGCVPLRIDWMAGRGLRPLGAAVVDRPTHRGQAVSDHSPLQVEFQSDP